MMLLTTALFVSYFFSILGYIVVSFSDISKNEAPTFDPVFALT